MIPFQNLIDPICEYLRNLTLKLALSNRIWFILFEKILFLSHPFKNEIALHRALTVKLETKKKNLNTELAQK